MGLNIAGYESDKEYQFGYSGLHQIRALALMVLDKFDTYKEAFEWLMFGCREDELWDTNYSKWLKREGIDKFWQLFHFVDGGSGLMVKAHLLRNVDYSTSMRLGNLDTLYDELEAIREAITTNPEKYDVRGYTVMKPFWMLYNLVKDEAENGIILYFH